MPWARDGGAGLGADRSPTIMWRRCSYAARGGHARRDRNGPVALTVEQAHPVNTGALLPVSCNAVIMIEQTQALGDDGSRSAMPVAPWQHVR